MLDAYTYYNFGISYIGTIDNIVGLGGYIEKKPSNSFKIKHLYNFYGRIIHVTFMLIIDSKIFIVYKIFIVVYLQYKQYIFLKPFDNLFL